MYSIKTGFCVPRKKEPDKSNNALHGSANQQNGPKTTNPQLPNLPSRGTLNLVLGNNCPAAADSVPNLSRNPPIAHPKPVLFKQQPTHTTTQETSTGTPNKTDTMTDEHKRDQPKTKRSIELKPPVKPNSSFLNFLRKNRDALIKSGLTDEDAHNKAVEMWHCKSPAVKKKLDNQHKKQKVRYEADMIKYNDKLKKINEREEKKKGELFIRNS